MSEAGAVEGDHPDGPGLFGGAEEPIAAFEQFAQVKLEAAAHGPNVAGIQVGVDEVLEVGQPVARGHVEQGVGVGAVPVEVTGDVVGGDGEGEHASISIAFRHHVDERPVDQRHFFREVPVAEIAHVATDEGIVLGYVGGAGPVEGEVGKGGLRSPPAGHIEIENKLLHALPDVAVVKVIEPDKRR